MKSVIMLITGKSKDMPEMLEDGAMQWEVAIADFERERQKAEATFVIKEECENICTMPQWFCDTDEPDYWRRDYCMNNCSMDKARRTDYDNA